MTADSPARRFLLHASLIALCTFMVFPIVWAAITSFKPTNAIFDVALPGDPTLANYTAAVSSFPLWRLLGNTFVMAAAVTLGQLVLAILAAYALARFRFRGKTLAWTLIIGTILFPPQILITPMYIMTARMGMIDTFAGLIVPQLAVGAFGVFLLRQHVLSVPQSLFDAAELDGAKEREILRMIVLPAVRPALGALGIVYFISSWNEYLWPLLATEDLASTTIQVGLQTFIPETGGQWGPLMAAGTLSTIPVMVVYLFAQRRIINAFMQAGVRR